MIVGRFDRTTNTMNFPSRFAAVLLLACALAGSAFAAERTSAEAEKVAQQALAHAIIIDTHADTPQMMLDEGYDLAQPGQPLHGQHPKMREGHLGASSCPSGWTRSGRAQDLIHRALDLIDAVNQQVARHPARTGAGAHR